MKANLELGEQLSGAAPGRFFADLIVEGLTDLSKWSSDQVDDLVNTILGDVPNLDEEQMRSFNNACYKYDPSNENLEACKRARY